MQLKSSFITTFSMLLYANKDLQIKDHFVFNVICPSTRRYMEYTSTIKIQILLMLHYFRNTIYFALIFPIMPHLFVMLWFLNFSGADFENIREGRNFLPFFQTKPILPMPTKILPRLVQSQ